MEEESRHPKEATEFTVKENKAFKKTLPSDDGTDAANVAKGFIATRTNPIIEKHEPNACSPSLGIFLSQISSKGNLLKPSILLYGVKPA